jgi:hypothetical protein
LLAPSSFSSAEPGQHGGDASSAARPIAAVITATFRNELLGCVFELLQRQVLPASDHACHAR